MVSGPRDGGGQVRFCGGSERHGKGGGREVLMKMVAFE